MLLGCGATELYNEIVGLEDKANSKETLNTKDGSPDKIQEQNLCEVCGISVLQSSFHTHLQSKKHRNAIVEQRIRKNQQEGEYATMKTVKRKRKLSQHAFLFNEVFSVTSILSRVSIHYKRAPYLLN